MKQLLDQCYLCVQECKEAPTICDLYNVGYTENNLCPKGTFDYKITKLPSVNAFPVLAFKDL
jgi:hypothetical protein